MTPESAPAYICLQDRCGICGRVVEVNWPRSPTSLVCKSALKFRPARMSPLVLSEISTGQFPTRISRYFLSQLQIELLSRMFPASASLTLCAGYFQRWISSVTRRSWWSSPMVCLFIRRSLQCRKCMKLGHKSSVCTSTTACCRCSVGYVIDFFKVWTIQQDSSAEQPRSGNSGRVRKGSFALKRR